MSYKTLIAAAILATLATPTLAQSKGDLTVGIGIHNVQPKSSNGNVAANTLSIHTGNSVRPTITGEYFLADNLGLELIAAVPFQHSISAKTTAGGVSLGQVASTKQLPPTLSLQYHFAAPDAAIKPFIGAGLNYTWFYGTHSQGALYGNTIKLSNSWGAGVHGGVDFKIGSKGAIRIDARWINIKSDVSLNGSKIGTVKIDPWVYGASYVFKL